MKSSLPLTTHFPVSSQSGSLHNMHLSIPCTCLNRRHLPSSPIARFQSTPPAASANNDNSPYSSGDINMMWRPACCPGYGESSSTEMSFARYRHFALTGVPSAKAPSINSSFHLPLLISAPLCCPQCKSWLCLILSLNQVVLTSDCNFCFYILNALGHQSDCPHYTEGKSSAVSVRSILFVMGATFERRIACFWMLFSKRFRTNLALPKFSSSCLIVLTITL